MDGKRQVIKKLYEKAKSGSYLHAQLLLAYMYGKPTDKVDLTSNGQTVGDVKHEIIFKDYSKHAGS